MILVNFLKLKKKTVGFYKFNISRIGPLKRNTKEIVDIEEGLTQHF